MKRILTYGTYDLLHYGHIRLLQRAKALGDYLIVALSTDEFNEQKGKKAYHNYETRKKMLEDKKYEVDVVVMGSDWAGSDRFNYLKDYCEVVYLDRTEGISTTKIKQDLGLAEPTGKGNQLPEPSQNNLEEKTSKKD